MPATIEFLTDDEWPGGFDFELPVSVPRSALLCVDVQTYCTDPAGHLAATIQSSSPGGFAEYAGRVAGMLRNVIRLQRAFREAGRPLVHTRHGALAADGTDLVQRRRSRENSAGESGHMPVRGTPGHEILAEAAPLDSELVLDKDTSSAFNSTPIDLVLRNMGLDTLVVCGLAAEQCVNITSLDAADRGFHVMIASDACAGFDPGLARACQVLFRRVYGSVVTTDGALGWLQRG